MEISGDSGNFFPSSLPARSCISADAFLVNVTARMRLGRTAVLDQASNPMGDDPRLARSGAGQHEQRPGESFHGVSLRWIQIVRHQRSARVEKIGRKLDWQPGQIVSGPAGAVERRSNLSAPSGMPT